MLCLFFEEYLCILILLVLACLLSAIIFAASFFLSIQIPDSEKLSAYECGFDPYEDARNSFDIRFYIVAILFILFDIEAMFLFPWVVSLTSTSYLGFSVMIDFLIELVVGFFYAWKIGALDWN